MIFAVRSLCFIFVFGTDYADYADLGLDCLASVIWVSKLPMRGHPARGGSKDLAFYLGALAEIDEKADLFAGSL